MTRRRMLLWVLAAVLYLVGVVVMYAWGSSHDALWSKVAVGIKDLATILVALPAAVLTAAFQRRTSYLTSLREQYARTVSSVQRAIQYTHLPAPTQSDFAAVKLDLSTAIDLFRSSFKNVDESSTGVGLFPFEALKTITDWIDYLGFGASFKNAEASTVRTNIVNLWKTRLRPALVQELDRQRPTTFDSPYWTRGSTAGSWPHPPRRRERVEE